MRLPVFRPVHLIILHEQAGAAAAACVQKDRAPILRQQIQVVVVVLGSAVGGGVAEYEANHRAILQTDIIREIEAGIGGRGELGGPHALAVVLVGRRFGIRAARIERVAGQVFPAGQTASALRGRGCRTERRTAVHAEFRAVRQRLSAVHTKHRVSPYFM